jgi:predicted GNAT family acetyltransferase
VTPNARLRVERFATAQAFLDVASPLLAEREAEHNLIFGISANLIADPTFSAGPPYLAAVIDASRVVAAGIMTPPWNIVLSCVDDPDAADDRDAWSALAADLDAAVVSVPGTTGSVESAQTFARVWCDAHGLASRLVMAERIYRLERVITPVDVSGHARVATEADRALLIAWVDAFIGEALDRRGPDEASVLVDRAFRTGSRTWYIWEDGEPVSVAAAGGPTPNGIRIGPVYTPPELRRRGYASAVTAYASQTELDKGRKFIFLFTNLANLTANRIYQQIGYEPVIDVDQIAFEPPAERGSETAG